MTVHGPGKLARMNVSDTDRRHGTSRCNAIVERARQEETVGAAVARGIERYGINSRIHTA